MPSYVPSVADANTAFARAGDIMDIWCHVVSALLKHLKRQLAKLAVMG